MMRKRFARPLATVCAAFLSMLLLCFFLPTTLRLCCAFVALFAGLLAVVLFSGGELSGQKTIVLLCCVVSFFAAWGQINIAYDRPLARITENPQATVFGVVEKVSYEAPYLTFYQLRAKRINGKRILVSLSVECQFEAAVQVGDRVTLHGTLVPITAEQMKDGSTDDRLTYYFRLADRCLGTMTIADRESQIRSAGSDVTYNSIFAAVRRFGSERLEKGLNQNAAALSKALLLGDRTKLDPAVKRNFRRLGISHMLAVSGMHLSIIVMGVAFLLHRLQCSKKSSDLISIVTVLFFMGVTGFSSSVLRSGMMMLVFFMSFHFHGAADACTSLFAAVTAICVVAPLSVFDVGLQLSFLATLGLIVMFSSTTQFLDHRCFRRNRAMRLLKAALPTLFATIAATVFTLPVVYLFYGSISVLSPLSNLLMVLPLTALLYLTPLLVLFQPLPWIGVLLGVIIECICLLVTWVCQLLSSVHHCLISLRYPFVLPLLITAMVFIIIVVIIVRRWYVPYIGVIVTCLVFASLLSGWRDTYANKAFVRFYSDASANEALFVTVNERLFVADNSTGTYRRLHMALNAALSGTDTEADALLITHLHSIHATSLQRLCQNAYIRRVYLPRPETDAEEILVADIKADLKALHVAVNLFAYNIPIALNGTYFTVFCSPPLSRSKQERISMYLDTPGAETVCLSPAYGEQEDDAAAIPECLMNAIAEAENQVFLAHGPKIKQPFGREAILDDLHPSRIVLSEAAAPFAADAFLSRYKNVIMEQSGYGGLCELAPN